jgi:hypothetical protein
MNIPFIATLFNLFCAEGEKKTSFGISAADSGIERCRAFRAASRKFVQGQPQKAADPRRAGAKAQLILLAYWPG